MGEAAEGGVRAFLSSHFGRLPRAFWVVWSGVLVTRMGTMVVPFLALYLTTEQHMSPASAGLVVTAVGVGGISAQFVGGLLADVWGRRTTFAIGPIAAAIALLALGYVEGLPLTLAMAFLSGLALQLYQPAAGAVIADVVDPEDRPRAYGLVYWAVNVGFSVAAVLGGVLARHGFWWLFWIDSLTCLAFGLLVWRFLPRDEGPGRDRSQAGSYRQVFADRVMVAYALLLLVHVSVQFQVSSTLPLAMSADGLSPTEYGLAVAVNGVLVVLLQPFVVKRLAGYDRSAVIAAGAFLIGAGYGLTAFAETVVAYAATTAIWTLGEIAVAAVVQTVVAELAPPELRGRYLGLFGAVYALGAVVAPMWGTVTLERLGADVLWFACFLLGAGAAGGQLALGPQIRARRNRHLVESTA